MRRKIIIGILGLAALVSCSVKEDRSDCPCWITVIADKAISLSAWYGNQRILDNHGGGLEDHTVPRGIVDLVASYGSFTVPEGEQMTELFAQLQHLNTNGETALTGIELQKQFATVYMDFKDEDDGRTGYDILIYGNYVGADIRTLAPVGGNFRCIPEEAPERGYMFRVPRQKDDSLSAVLSYNGNAVETIPVGELIRKAGFDWTSQSLGDVSILADLPAHTFTITIMEWEGPVTFEITI